MKKVTKTDEKVKDRVADLIKNVSWVVGIDIGKGNLFCALMNINKDLICRFKVAGSIKGYDELLERVKKETNGRGKVVFAMEPTGHYWMVLGQFLEDHNRSYVLIHPLAVARSREIRRLNKGKTDPMDARLVGELACNGSITRTQIPEDYWATIRFYAREYMDREKEIAREKNRTVSYLETILPEFLDIFPKPLCMNGRACLRAFVNFKEILKGNEEQFEARVRKHFPGKRLLKSRVRRLHNTLQRGMTLGLRSGRQAMLLRIIHSLDRLETYETQKAVARQAMLDVYDKCDYKEYLDSIQGTTSTVNALVLGFMGDPALYDKPTSLIKQAGCDPVHNESGKFRGKTFISHRGRNLLRKAGDRVSFLLEKQNTVFRSFFKHLMNRQKNKLTKRQARVACINKYFRIIWVLCRYRVHFNPALA